MRFILVALSGKKYDGEVYEVLLPTKDGQIGVLDHHMPLFGVVSPGIISVRVKASDPDRSREFFGIYGGAIEVANNTLKVLVDEAHQPEEINESEVHEAIKRAEKMKREAKDETSLEQAQALVDRQSVRLQVSSLRRRRL